MKKTNDAAFDDFIDDCLVEGDKLFIYDQNNLDLVASNIVQGIWNISEEKYKQTKIPDVLLLKEMQVHWDEEVDEFISS